MTPRGGRLLVRLAVGAALPLLALLAVAPGRAAATCGDYLKVMAHEPAPAPAHAPAAPKPCSGPHCSNAPPAAPLAPARVAPDWGGDPAVLDGVPAPPGPHRSTVPADGSVHVPTPPARDIDPPPRAR